MNRKSFNAKKYTIGLCFALTTTLYPSAYGIESNIVWDANGFTGYIITDANSIKIICLSDNWCDLHYTVNSGTLQNLRMPNDGKGRSEYRIDNLLPQDKVKYYLTYSQSPIAYDTEWFNYTISSSGNGETPPPISGGNLPDAYPGYTGVYKNFTLEVDERFDSFDSNRWAKGDASFGETACRFTNQGVAVGNGQLELVIRREFVPGSWSNDHGVWRGDENYSCGEIRSKNSYLYGRFESRILNPEPSKATGYISSLFTYVNNPSDNYRWREIDVEIEGGRPTMFQSNLIFGENTYNWSDTRQWGAWESKHEIGNTNQWKVYAFEWTPESIKWFVDGVLIRTLSKNDVDGNPLVAGQNRAASIPEIAQKIMMNFWIPNDAVQDTFGGNKRGNVYPMKVKYDWFRYYRYDLAH